MIKFYFFSQAILLIFVKLLKHKIIVLKCNFGNIYIFVFIKVTFSVSINDAILLTSIVQMYRDLYTINRFYR